LYRWYKFKNECRITGQTFSAPQDCELLIPCAIVANGVDDESARKQLTEHCDALKGTDVTIRTDQIDHAIEQLNKAENT
jgi:hypothetical protein